MKTWIIGINAAHEVLEVKIKAEKLTIQDSTTGFRLTFTVDNSIVAVFKEGATVYVFEEEVGEPAPTKPEYPTPYDFE